MPAAGLERRQVLGVAQRLELVVQRLLAGGEVGRLRSSRVVAANDACCIWVLKQSSPTTPPSSTRLTSVTNGIRGRADPTTVRYDGQPGALDRGLGAAAATARGAGAAGVLMLLARGRWAVLMRSTARSRTEAARGFGGDLRVVGLLGTRG